MIAELERNAGKEGTGFSPRANLTVRGDGEGSSSGSDNSPPPDPPGGELKPVAKPKVLESQYSPRPA